MSLVSTGWMEICKSQIDTQGGQHCEHSIGEGRVNAHKLQAQNDAVNLRARVEARSFIDTVVVPGSIYETRYQIDVPQWDEN